MLSAMFSHDPPSGVYSGMIPCANSQQTNAGVLCPARLSSTSSIRSGGSSAGSVGLIVRPSCHRSHAARDRVGRRRAASGSAARIGGQLPLEPGVQDRVGAGRHALEADPPVGRVEQRQHLGRAVAEVLVRLPGRLGPRAARTGRGAGPSGTARPGRCTRPPAPSPRPGGRRPRSTFFRLGVRVGDDHRRRPCGGGRPCRSGTRCGSAGSCSRPRGGPARWCRSRPAAGRRGPTAAPCAGSTATRWPCRRPPGSGAGRPRGGSAPARPAP